MKTSLENIEEFLGHKRIAIVGVSRNPKDFSVTLLDEFVRRGYDVVPVNPNIAAFQGRRCFTRVQQIEPPVEAALLMTAPDVTETVVKDCAEAGIKNVWMYRAGGKGAVSPAAVQSCQEQGMSVVPGQCPFMFWADAGRFHRWHGLIRKITGKYPPRTGRPTAKAA